MTGGLVPLSTTNRVAVLEDEVQQLRLELEQLRREPSPDNKLQVRIAKTGSASVYPTNGNTFGLIFQDAEFIESEGDQTLDYTALKGVPQRIGHSPGGYVGEGANVYAFKLVAPNGKWQWFVVPFGAGVRVGITSGVMTARSGSTAGTGTVQPKSRAGTTYGNDGDTVTVYNWSDYEVADSTWMLFDSATMELISLECP